MCFAMLSVLQLCVLLFSFQGSFLGYLADIVDVYLDEGTAISEASASILFEKCSDIGSTLDPLYNENLLNQIE